MKIERHPFEVFIPHQVSGMIIGSFPIGKFSDPDRKHEIKQNELNFYFGGEKNLLWRLIANSQKMKVSTKAEVIEMLSKMRLGIGDMIKSCHRLNGGASDSALKSIVFNTDLIHIIRKNKIHTLYFTSRKVEDWFNKVFPDTDDLKKVSLISPSAQTLRSIGRHAGFKEWKKKYPEKSALDFLYADYKRIFSRINRNGD